jgi:hypothetical protein
MVTGVTVNFANPEKAIVANGTYDAITLRNEGTDSERWAILLPQDAVIGGIAKIGESFYSYNVEAVAENSYITSNPINNSAPITEPLFTVSSNGNFVRFSTGNLQYNKETGKFSFMEHQYSTVETTDQDVGDDYANQNIVSLFGWGTSGWDNGNTYTYSLTDTYANADWGVYNKQSNQNKIEGGGNHAWRVLTSEEWDYLFSHRLTTSKLLKFFKFFCIILQIVLKIIKTAFFCQIMDSLSIFSYTFATKMFYVWELKSKRYETKRSDNRSSTLCGERPPDTSRYQRLSESRRETRQETARSYE